MDAPSNTPKPIHDLPQSQMLPATANDIQNYYFVTTSMENFSDKCSSRSSAFNFFM